MFRHTQSIMVILHLKGSQSVKDFLEKHIQPSWRILEIECVSRSAFLVIRLCVYSVWTRLRCSSSFLQQKGADQTPYQLLKFSLDAARGMEYITSQDYIHRDLAARNCWIGRHDNILKISGFSLCRKTEEGICPLTSHDKQIPAKWTAPEVSAM